MARRARRKRLESRRRVASPNGQAAPHVRGSVRGRVRRCAADVVWSLHRRRHGACARGTATARRGGSRRRGDGAARELGHRRPVDFARWKPRRARAALQGATVTRRRLAHGAAARHADGEGECGAAQERPGGRASATILSTSARGVRHALVAHGTPVRGPALSRGRPTRAAVAERRPTRRVHPTGHLPVGHRAQSRPTHHAR